MDNSSTPPVWHGKTWKIYAVSNHGLNHLMANAGSKPSSFQLTQVAGDPKAYNLAVDSDGPSSFQLVDSLRAVGDVPTNNLKLTRENGGDSLNQLDLLDHSVLPLHTEVSPYWAVHELFFSGKPLAPRFHRLEGNALINGEEHFVDLYQFGGVLKQAGHSLLLMRVLICDNKHNSDGWAVGHN